MTSGGYDPIHPGHVSYLMSARSEAYKQQGPWHDPGWRVFHVAVVNGDGFLTKKKGRPFMPLLDRCRVVSAVKGVDMVVGFEIDDDMTVIKALEEIRPTYFAKGGDRTGIENIPEWKTCQDLRVEILTGVGAEKRWSSSNYLADWSRH